MTRGPYRPRTVCLKGHSLDGENLMVRVDSGREQRMCRECHHRRASKHYRTYRASHPERFQPKPREPKPVRTHCRSGKHQWVEGNITSRGICRACRKENYHLNKSRVRGYQIQTMYGITIEEYDELLESQNGLCAICRKPNQGKRRLAIDHNHHTGLVRGLLCGKCNTALGQFNDDVGILKRAIRYLKDGG